MGRDRWSAAGLALLAVMYLLVARRYPLDTLATPGPGVVPLITGVVLLAVAISLFIVAGTERPARHVGGLSETGAAPTRPTESARVLRSPLVLAAALLLYTALLPRLGFIACSFVLVVLASRLMGARGWWRPVVLGLGIAATAHLLFARWLGVPLP